MQVSLHCILLSCSLWSTLYKIVKPFKDISVGLAALQPCTIGFKKKLFFREKLAGFGALSCEASDCRACSHWDCLAPAMRGWDEGMREKRLAAYHEQGRRMPLGGREQKSRWNEPVSASLQLFNFWTCCCQLMVTGELPKALSHPWRLADCLAYNTPGAPVLHRKFSLGPFTSFYKGLGGSKGAWDAVALPANL